LLVKKPQAILFDLDGTLVDSVPDLVVAVNLMLSELSLPLVDDSKVRQWIGNGAAVLVRRALLDRLSTASVDEELLKQALPIFITAYHHSNGLSTMLFPGVAQTLKFLSEREIPLAVVTNKPIEFVPGLLSKLGIGAYFSTLVGGDCASERKPSAAPLLLACENLGVDVAKCLMVGDSKNDIGAARNAGMPVAAVCYGYNHGEEISISKPDIILNDFDELSVFCGF
jgi:phosphoglycolate phosphatase